MRLKKRKIRHDLKAWRERGCRGGGTPEAERKKEVYEPVTQHYIVTTSWTIINTANEHRGKVALWTTLTLNNCGGISLVPLQR